MSVANWDKLRLILNPGEQDAPDGGRREYDIYPIETVEPDTTKTATSISVPGQAPEQNVFFGISGMERDISISFSLYDDGSDRANGSHTSTVTTVEEQLLYLEDVMHEPAFSAKWELQDLTSNRLRGGTEVFFENISVPYIDRNSPKWKPATMRLRVGQSI